MLRVCSPMGGGITGRSASVAGCASFFVLLSAALAASAPVTTLPPGGYNGFYEQVCRARMFSSLRVHTRMPGSSRSTSIATSNNHKALSRRQHALIMLQMYITNHDPSTSISTFPDFPNLTPNYTFNLPNLTSTSQPGLWSNNVSIL